MLDDLSIPMPPVSRKFAHDRRTGEYLGVATRALNYRYKQIPWFNRLVTDWYEVKNGEYVAYLPPSRVTIRWSMLEEGEPAAGPIEPRRP